MIKNIILPFILIAFFSNSTLAKSPPPGTGSLVPSNIMIMLDNSGSMSWNLSGAEITTNSLLRNPTDIETDSAGNVYVYSLNLTFSLIYL